MSWEQLSSSSKAPFSTEKTWLSDVYEAWITKRNEAAWGHLNRRRDPRGPWQCAGTAMWGTSHTWALIRSKSLTLWRLLSASFRSCTFARSKAHIRSKKQRNPCLILYLKIENHLSVCGGESQSGFLIAILHWMQVTLKCWVTEVQMKSCFQRTN